MSKKFLTNLDLNQNELQNAKIQILASDPANAEARIYYNSVIHQLKIFNGTAWVPVGASITVKTNDNILYIDATNPASPTIETKLSATQGTAVTLTREADGLKVVVDEASETQKGITQLSSTPSATENTKGITPKGAYVSLEEQATAETGYLKTYVIKQAGTEVGKINIPKDFLVKGGRVTKVSNYAVATAYKKCDIINHESKSYIVKADISASDNTQFSDVSTIEQSVVYTIGDSYIVLNINSKTTTSESDWIVINAKDLVDVYTEGEGIDITNNVISVDNGGTDVQKDTTGVYPTQLTKKGLVKSVGDAIKINKKITSTLSAGSTSGVLAIPADSEIVSFYALDNNGDEIILEVRIVAPNASTAGSITFTLGQAVSFDITLVANYTNATIS